MTRLYKPFFFFLFLFIHNVKIGIVGENFAAIAAEELDGSGGRFMGKVASVERKSDHGSICV